jgi:hypothetical protein
MVSVTNSNLDSYRISRYISGEVGIIFPFPLLQIIIWYRQILGNWTTKVFDIKRKKKMGQKGCPALCGNNIKKKYYHIIETSLISTWCTVETEGNSIHLIKWKT